MVVVGGESGGGLLEDVQVSGSCFEHLMARAVDSWSCYFLSSFQFGLIFFLLLLLAAIKCVLFLCSGA